MYTYLYGRPLTNRTWSDCWLACGILYRLGLSNGLRVGLPDLTVVASVVLRVVVGVVLRVTIILLWLKNCNFKKWVNSTCYIFFQREWTKSIPKVKTFPHSTYLLLLVGYGSYLNEFKFCLNGSLGTLVVDGSNEFPGLRNAEPGS